mmetsp:Transcript_35555/g.48581  ORF Transcript_35555/g.48581 Transcript_35555/m.48581 type:complete len:175 (-) Transcript_35555:2-526(-)
MAEDPKTPVPTTTGEEEEQDGPTLLQPDQPLTDMPSYCFNCGEEGRTRMLYTSIPYFREIILMSFRCKECNFTSTEIQTASEIQPQGIHYHLELQNPEDLNRQVVKGEHATISFLQLELEIPPIAQKGSLNTIEGLLTQTVDHLTESLKANPPGPEQLVKMVQFIEQLKKICSG